MRSIIFITAALLGIPACANAIELRTAAQDSSPKYYQSGNEMKGLAVDIMQAIERVQPEIKFTGYNSFAPFPRIEAGLKGGELDAFLGMIKNPDREKQYTFLDPALYSTHNVMAVRADDTVEVKSFDDIRKLGGEGVILVSHATAQVRFLEDVGGLQVDPNGKSTANNIEKLLARRGRFVYQTDIALSQTIKEAKRQDQVRILPVSFHDEAQYMVLSKNIPESTVALVKGALDKLKLNGELDKILSQYTGNK
ncbi:transporter substrate-binding domain-containing protein [Azospirillum sp. TSO22-1]|uniref:substrate-binding periplasmic protein n=1 Tax=Azospirillum sp. TSO22-1 TaxID=716789 RepID=UPI000D644A2F|nr:transporter substrate-binding domain-containing protein [Azospirillum sp. TSO22-1]